MSNQEKEQIAMNNHTPNRRINETRDIHPLVAEWLTENGYTYEHEYKMPDYGVVDFLATHADGHKLLVEAKPYTNHKKAIFQALGYAIQLENVAPAIAIPEDALTPELKDIAGKYNVRVIGLNVVTAFDVEEPVTPDVLLSTFRQKLIWAIITAKANYQYHPNLNHGMNVLIFNTATDCCDDIEKTGIEMDTSIILVVNEILEAFRFLKLSHPQSSLVLHWICQDTTEGGFYELFKF